MLDPILDALSQIWEDGIDYRDFEQVLADYGFMIVPIEDPTNLRYGAEDE